MSPGHKDPSFLSLPGANMARSPGMRRSCVRTVISNQAWPTFQPLGFTDSGFKQVTVPGIHLLEEESRTLTLSPIFSRASKAACSVFPGFVGKGLGGGGPGASVTVIPSSEPVESVTPAANCTANSTASCFCNSLQVATLSFAEDEFPRARALNRCCLAVWLWRASSLAARLLFSVAVLSLELFRASSRAARLLSLSIFRRV
mmetsp:Transcript_16114/g.41444  ORF Transcript_16114/g.41444 Transcript_16114/m.41444 type:complete len:202 (+) Transcript_16114:337-942(+)